MTLATIVHRSSLLRPSFTRHVSSTPITAGASSTPRQPASLLPPEKLRALISLYHQSQDFITPSNLSDKIDQAFTTGFYSANSSGTHFASQGELAGTLSQRKSEPRIGESNLQTYTNERTWSTLARREDEVFDALYGVDNLKKPGLGALLDEEEKIQAVLRDDEQASL